ncbi:MAG: aminoacyl-tRNA hydrolase [Bacteroidia bacterium]|nr:aminoacyl-tRNA hydrolase [Bacteroidia bacterium]
MNYLIIGLGNVGSQYDQTRHNIGFEILDSLAKELDTQFTLSKHAMIAEARVKNKTFLMIKPTTFMNLSGKAVQHYLQLTKTPLENILVITDDLALDTGMIRIRSKGSHGGHNGLRNIEETLNTQQYPRMRFGIGNHFDKHRQVDFVLGKWKADEMPIIQEKIQKASDAIKSFMLEGIGQAMTKFNG